VRRIPQWPRLAAVTVTAHEMDKGTGFVYFLLDLFAQFSQFSGWYGKDLDDQLPTNLNLVSSRAFTLLPK
jgi:hypothetical protein